MSSTPRPKADHGVPRGTDHAFTRRVSRRSTWVRSSTRDGAFRWTGRANGLRGVILKCRRMRSRDWRITLKSNSVEALRRVR